MNFKWTEGILSLSKKQKLPSWEGHWFDYDLSRLFAAPTGFRKDKVLSNCSKHYLKKDKNIKKHLHQSNSFRKTQKLLPQNLPQKNSLSHQNPWVFPIKTNGKIPITSRSLVQRLASVLPSPNRSTEVSSATSPWRTLGAPPPAPSGEEPGTLSLRERRSLGLAAGAIGTRWVSDWLQKAPVGSGGLGIDVDVVFW